MILSQLKPAHRRKKKRLGQGKASGKGGTSTKGHKGQKARAGVKIARGFEGGQMSLVRRLPKFGFSNHVFKKNYDVVNLEQLNQCDGEVLLKDMIERKWVRKKNLVKILGNGSLKKSLKVSAHQFSKKARQEIEKQGGQALYIEKKKR